MTREALDGVESLVPWRRSRLRRAGLDADLAARIAADQRYDVPELLALIDRGCSPGLAVRILFPLETER